MKNSRYSSSRQKACQNCSISKAKCDRGVGRCNRCITRGLNCTYARSHPVENSAQNAIPPNSIGGPCSPASLADSLGTGFGDEMPSMIGSTRFSDFTSTGNMAMPASVSGSPATLSLNSGRMDTAPTAVANTCLPRNAQDGVDILDFSGLELLCPIDVNGITSRWMNPFIPDSEQRIKQYPASIITFICRIFKSYAGSAIRGRGVLPFIHPTQMKRQVPNLPLSTCLSLVRMCQHPLPGSENAAIMILQREMDNITESRETYDNMSLLAAFQAYLIYSMVLYFRLDVARDHSLRHTMITLQELAHASCKGGLVCATDQARTRPRWEEWIITEAKRRTLYMMYLFDSVISTQENVPTYLGTELQGLPAPAARMIWEAGTRSDWEQAYNLFLAEWMEPSLAIDELWPIPVELNEVEIAKRRSRVDHWLEDIDGFGTMLYAVVSCTHGG
ncbi:hypothetical protein N7481_000418 [Penicillium waksmanii]|uniref:uncharacterized protein n=1 Tax=Penicillium waksmanii TaxID=69791 RepID=UPI0025494202|nr:uncharacterized protein N7481_000418 [Penicillium waksmanii]KAJ6000009.1 hypothetical protein N7481_000418 [Penicillium waksmanii]